MFRNVNLNNLESVLQRNPRTDRAGECIFRASGGTNFENFPAQRQLWWCLRGFDVYTGLPKKTLDCLYYSTSWFSNCFDSSQLIVSVWIWNAGCKHSIRPASQADEQLKTYGLRKLRSFRRRSNLGGDGA